MIVRTLTKHAVETEPWSVWNAYVNLLAMEDYRDLSPEQRPAHLVFWYEHEVQNGGHFQYFENLGTEHLAETISALELLRATGQQQILREASELWLSRSRPRIQTVEEFCAAELEREFNTLDSRFHLCTPALVDCLETYLNDHQSSFVRIE
ncbi:MAG: DMP19 family protein [Planctomycetes bacterium]|nr:DMP19 family protein [Planctomycetota bacterium]